MAKKPCIHILGVAGTFMAGIAAIAKQLAYRVEGTDEKVYPPMSTQLEEQGIRLYQGYTPEVFQEKPDVVLVGNVIRRGNPAIEYCMNQDYVYQSGPEWLAKEVLLKKRVIAVSGTHGKTTTSSLLAWVMEVAGFHPGFLIGGVPENFGISARVTESPYFVIEADEYDSAFFDKRSKFIHYHPEYLIINNIEFDHADIFSDLAAIQTQFHYLVRTVPQKGLIVAPAGEAVVQATLDKGCWTPVCFFGESAEWTAVQALKDGSCFTIQHHEKPYATISWSLIGEHNVMNALAVAAIAHRLGISGEVFSKALASFKNVKRRMEVKGCVKGVTVYDDFAHHPTAIETTLGGLRAKVGQKRIVACLELGSYTMRTGVHQKNLMDALSIADEVYFIRPKAADWDIDALAAELKQKHAVFETVEQLVSAVAATVKTGDHILLMSNHAFGGAHDRLLEALEASVI